MYNIDRVIKIANYVTGCVPTPLNSQSYQNQYRGQRKKSFIQA